MGRGREMGVFRGGCIETEEFQGANLICDSSLPSAHTIKYMEGNIYIFYFLC